MFSMLSVLFFISIDISVQKQSVGLKLFLILNVSRLTRMLFFSDHLMNLYNSILRDLLDEHAYLGTKEMPILKCSTPVKFKFKISLPLPNQNIHESFSCKISNKMSVWAVIF